MQTFLKRYQDEEFVAVWAELVALGPIVRNEPWYTDARAVAHEMMSRAKHNVALLVKRLTQLDYRFVEPRLVWRPPDAKLATTLDALEQRYGPLPLVIRAWYEIVGSVNLVGAHPKLSQHYGFDWGESNQLNCYSDPMMVSVDGLDNPSGLVSFFIDRAEDEEEESRFERENPLPFEIDIGLSAINKANHSGGGAVAILAPNPVFDVPLIDFDLYWMGICFVPYLRSCFEWGGFPGFRLNDEDHVPREEIEFLRQDLLLI